MASSNPQAGPSSTASQTAEASIRDLSTRFPEKVQIHLHPSSSLPASLTSDTPSSSSTEALPVALVWTVPSLRLLRSYGLTGSFTGTLAQFPQQNIFLGLPIQLLPEEVVYLLRRGWAVVVDESSSYRSATLGEKEEWKRGVEEEKRSQQIEAWHERQLLRAKHSKIPIPASDPTEEDLEGCAWHYTIPSTSSSLPWYTPKTYTTLSSVQPIFPYPSTQLEVASVGLFEHFLSQSMWCMSGLRFGGAFAVYPGDPLRYHSHYTAQLVLKEEAVALTSMVANGRLGTAVKKTHLLCCVDQWDEEVEGEMKGRKGERGDERRRRLKCVKEGLFDKAEEGEGEGEGRKFATFDVFSLAWAGFGT